MKQALNAKNEVMAWADRNLDTRYVTLNPPAIEALIPPQGLAPMQANLTTKAVGGSLVTAIQFLVALNSLNYKFWEHAQGEFIRYSYDTAIGAMGMRKAFDAAWAVTVDATPATLRRNLREQSISALFGAIPDESSRGWILGSLLQDTLLEDFAGELAAKILATGELTTDDADLMAQVFPEAYRDPTLKKAQLAIAEIAGHCAEVGIKATPSLTVFADYQVPRVMRALGVISYCDELAQHIDSQQIVNKGSSWENSIRAATILAGDQIASRFKVDPSVVDNYLWLLRAQAGKAPFHLTRTTDY